MHSRRHGASLKFGESPLSFFPTFQSINFEFHWPYPIILFHITLSYSFISFHSFYPLHPPPHPPPPTPTPPPTPPPNPPFLLHIFLFPPSPTHHQSHPLFPYITYNHNTIIPTNSNHLSLPTYHLSSSLPTFTLILILTISSFHFHITLDSYIGSKWSHPQYQREYSWVY